jgi:hypothetical protein
MNLSEFFTDDFKEAGLGQIDWSGSATHIQNACSQLGRVTAGDAEYITVRDKNGNPVARGLIDHVKNVGASEIGQRYSSRSAGQRLRFHPHG